MNWIDRIIIQILFRRRALAILRATAIPDGITTAEAEQIADAAISDAEAIIAAEAAP